MHTVFALLCLVVVIHWLIFPYPSGLLTSLALWQSNDCPSASKVTLMNMDKYFMWIHYERLHNHNKAKHNKTVCIFLGIYCIQGLNSCRGVYIQCMISYQNHSIYSWKLNYRWSLMFGLVRIQEMIPRNKHILLKMSFSCEIHQVIWAIWLKTEKKWNW